MLILHIGLFFIGIGLYGEDQAASVGGQNPILEAIMKDPSRVLFEVSKKELETGIDKMTDEEFNRAIKILEPAVSEVDLKYDKKVKKIILLDFIKEAFNRTDEELEDFIKKASSDWEETKKEWTNPKEKRKHLLYRYALAMNNNMLLTQQKGLYYSFKSRIPDFILDGMGDRSSMVNLLQDFINQKPSQTEDQVKDDTKSIENLPTTGQIDAFNERIRDLPKEQMSFWVMLAMPYYFEFSLLPESMKKLKDFFGWISRNAISSSINFIFMWPLFTTAMLGYTLLDAVDWALAYRKVLWYWYNGDLYIVDVSAIDDEVSKLKKG